jgi:hypothetical protein
MSRVGALSAIVALFSSTLFAELAFSRLQLALDPRLCALFCRLGNLSHRVRNFLAITLPSVTRLARFETPTQARLPMLLPAAESGSSMGNPAGVLLTVCTQSATPAEVLTS